MTATLMLMVMLGLCVVTDASSGSPGQDDHKEPDDHGPSEETPISVMTFNILAPMFHPPEQHDGMEDPDVWRRRMNKEITKRICGACDCGSTDMLVGVKCDDCNIQPTPNSIVGQIRASECDVVCLQECQGYIAGQGQPKDQPYMCPLQAIVELLPEYCLLTLDDRSLEEGGDPGWHENGLWSEDIVNGWDKHTRHGNAILIKRTTLKDDRGGGCYSPTLKKIKLGKHYKRDYQGHNLQKNVKNVLGEDEDPEELGLKPNERPGHCASILYLEKNTHKLAIVCVHMAHYLYDYKHPYPMDNETYMNVNDLNEAYVMDIDEELRNNGISNSIIVGDYNNSVDGFGRWSGTYVAQVASQNGKHDCQVEPRAFGILDKLGYTDLLTRNFPEGHMQTKDWKKMYSKAYCTCYGKAYIGKKKVIIDNRLDYHYFKGVGLKRSLKRVSQQMPVQMPGKMKEALRQCGSDHLPVIGNYRWVHPKEQ